MSGIPPKRQAQHSDGFFRQLVDSISDYGIFMLDPHGRVRTWNAGAARISGYSADDIIGQHFSVFYPPEQVERGWPDYELAMAAEHGRFEDEGWRVRKDGTRFWANVVISPVRDASQKLIGFGKVTRDLSERRRQEEALRLSEERFRLLVDSVKDYAIFMLDPSGHIASWNKGAALIKGYTAGEIIGKHFSIFYPPEANARNWPENELQIAREQGRFEEENWRLRKDGTEFWANVVITALYNPDGSVRGFAKVTRDLTARRRYEELQRSERQINNFLAMLAHELRNPLAPLRHALDLMALGDDDADARARARHVIHRQVEQLTRLVDDLLDVSRITAGKITLKLGPVDLKQLVRDVVDSARPLANARAQVLETVMEQHEITCNADATRISQVVLNLITNAIKYTPEGGRITVEVVRTGTFGEVHVRDTGMGMSADLVARVFQPFVQGDRALDRAQGGLGLGLTLVRRLVEMHGGSVNAASAGEGQGSTFTMRVPLFHGALESPVLPVTNEHHQPTSAARHRILIVDDNVDAANTLGALVSALGHDVWTAHDGPGALSAAREHKPDAVLLDIGLPGMNGYQVVKELRRIPGVNATMIACTGYGHEGDRAAARAAGFDDHLVKPVEIGRLQEIIAGLSRHPVRPAAPQGA